MSRNPSREERSAAATIARGLASRSPYARHKALVASGHTEAEADALFAAMVGEIAWQARAIAVGEWSCACGVTYTAGTPKHPGSYPRASCLCGRPYPLRCLTPGCARVVEAREVETVSDRLMLEVPHRAGPLVELPAHGLCASCCSDAPYRARAKTWAQSSVPDAERAAAAREYWTTQEGRSEAIAAVNTWLGNNLGREMGPCALYLHGKPGRGKTRTVAWAAYQAVVERGLVASVTWTSQAQLRTWHDQRWQHDSDRARVLADIASAAWERCARAHLLVVDEMFSSAPRGAFAEKLADLVRERLNERLPTLYTSNHAPEWSASLETDGRIDSRWVAAGVTVEVGGMDWRTL